MFFLLWYMHLVARNLWCLYLGINWQFKSHFIIKMCYCCSHARITGLQEKSDLIKCEYYVACLLHHTHCFSSMDSQSNEMPVFVGARSLFYPSCQCTHVVAPYRQPYHTVPRNVLALVLSHKKGFVVLAEQVFTHSVELWTFQVYCVC